ncbi:phage holin family protein [Clostridium beijerinckii]|uniref:phage holin family protein n=1 Tax=Clostridium beijerinckii TaxID=1520 RepID=UPI0012B16E05|nr:phage holin family protein [Clostridium beijerinckii]MRY42706.1 holin [Parabacteroides distasonis]MZK52125.1 holin [Clostridium beijerinckii]MZK61254.1 holin [Clostridium beijerinckii]MZK71497.1 holin [Clostridium beijerinckii]MZK76856.1 holin [Clostridium beijerinckii]
MEFINYIEEQALILIPVLYILGMIIKHAKIISNRYIPIILLVFGVIGGIDLIGLNLNAVVHGVLATGTAVYTNQLFKQSCKKD